MKTNVLFFNRSEDGRGTTGVWYYELTNDGFELKSTRRPINGSQIPDLLAKWEKRVEGENSWTVSVKDIAARNWDLSARNPNKEKELDHKSTLELVQSLKAKEGRVMELLEEIEDLRRQKSSLSNSSLGSTPSPRVSAPTPKSGSPTPTPSVAPSRHFEHVQGSDEEGEARFSWNGDRGYGFGV